MIRKIYLLTLLLASYIISDAQITAPDTVIAGTPVSFSSSVEGVSYTWTRGDIDLTPTAPPTPTLIADNSSMLDVPSFSATANDNGTWYTFLTNYYSDDVIRLNHGTSPTNLPTSVDLGNFNMNGGVAGGIDIVKDPVSGDWFGFVVNGTDLLRLSFGNSLSNTPTSSIMSFPTTLAWPHEFKVKQFGQKWIGFAANRSLGIAKFDFGTSLTNTPTSVELPLTNLYSPVSFSVISQGNNWYMFVANLNPGSITRLDFGTDINNNVPTSVPLGDFNTMNLTRKIMMVKDCNQLFGYAYDEYSQLYKLDFNNDATNTTPSFSVLAPFNFNCMELFSYKNELRAMMMNTNSNVLMTSAFKTFDINKTTTNYYNQTQSYTFDTPGVYDIALAVDRGRFLDEKSSCKQIVVLRDSAALDSVRTSSVSNVANNKGGQILVFPNPVMDQLNIIAPTAGKFNIVVYNSTGQSILNATTSTLGKDQTLKIDLSHYSMKDGMYYLKLTNESGSSCSSRFYKGNK